MSRILIADDDPLHLEMVSTTLNRAGHEVRAVTSGWNCLALLQEDHYDLLVSDLFMPGLDGLQLVMSVRALDIDIPVIGMTGGAGGHFRPFSSSLMAAGADAVLKKPFEPADLLAEVLRLVPGAGEA